MIAPELRTDNAAVRLVAPDVERDAPLGVSWLQSPAGPATLRLMGAGAAADEAPTLENEQKRVQSFIDRADQYNWMIQSDGQVVGAIWVDLESSAELSGPSLHIMIGASEARGRGIGSAAIGAVLRWLHEVKNYGAVYSRHLVANKPAAKALSGLGFLDMDRRYVDGEGQTWQNMQFDSWSRL